MSVNGVKCHFCSSKSQNAWYYTVLFDYGKEADIWLGVCEIHYDCLYDMYSIYKYVPVPQKELLFIKKLEKELNISNTIQFKE